MNRKTIVSVALVLALSLPGSLLAELDIPRLEPPRAESALVPAEDGLEEPRATDPSAELLLRTLDHVHPLTPARLWEVFRSQVWAREHERMFFAHPAFASLRGEQSAFFDLMAEEEPRRLLDLHRRRGLGPVYERLLARLAEKEERILRRVSTLSIPEQMGLYLGGRTDLSQLSRKQKRALSRERRIERLLSDPSLELLPAVEDGWFAGLAVEHVASGLLYVDARELVQCKVMIARNLYFSGEAPTRGSVRRQYARILELRQRYRDVALFSRRDVVYAASSERAGRTERYVFGQSATREDLELQGARLAFLRDGEREAEKARLSAQLREAGPLTFLFEGHGRSEAILFASGITAKELTRSLAERRPSEAGRGATPPIFIPVTCLAHDLSRSLLGRLHAADPSAPKPITIVPEEYGQYFVKSLGRAPFWTQDLQLGREETTTLGTLFDHSRIGTSVYVPDERNVPVQIL